MVQQIIFQKLFSDLYPTKFSIPQQNNSFRVLHIYINSNEITSKKERNLSICSETLNLF